MKYTEPHDRVSKSQLSVSPDRLNRRAIFDFSFLTVITQLILAFIYADNAGFFLLLSLPYLITAILSKLDNNAVYPVTIVITVISILTGIITGNILISLKEWIVFFGEGQSVRFLELSYMILLTNYIGMGYYSVRKYFSKQNV